MSRKKAALIGAASLLLLAGLFSATRLHVVSAAGSGLTPQPIHMAGFPTPPNTIDGWVVNNNTDAMRTHAWSLWAGINYQGTGQSWPVWETWYSDTDVAAGPPTLNLALAQRVRPVHQFIRLRQFKHEAVRKGLTAAIDPNEQVVGFNKFNLDYSQFVWQNHYENPTTLGSVNQWPAQTPAGARHIENFPYPAIGLKPVFQVLNGPTHDTGNGKGITVMPYWKGDLTSGPSNSSNPKNPTPGTWNQCVVVKTGSAGPTAGTKCKDGSMPKVIGPGLFYNFVLSAQEAKDISQAQGVQAQQGDYAVLVAMHMTSRENFNWTWQTFWWNYGQTAPYGPPPASVPAPFNNYAMCTAYSMTVNNDPAKPNTLCYNPYLETSPGIPDGIHSDCMSCHHTASFGTNQQAGYPASYSPTSYIEPGFGNDNAQYFNCQTTTDFSWFLGNLAKPPQKGPGCP
jgi:hypothetical protein